MAKFEKIEVNGEYRFQAVNAAARKLAAKFGYGLIDIGGMLLLSEAAKGKVQFA